MRAFDLPEFPVPDGYTPDTYLEELARQGLDGRLEDMQALGGQPDRDIYAFRLEYELRIIRDMRLSPLFLIVWDYVRYARGRGIPVGPGRGASPSSLVAYALKITGVDPVRHGLIFERFLNPEADDSFPHLIDLDFGNKGHVEVARYVTEKYGEGLVRLYDTVTEPEDSAPEFFQFGIFKNESLAILHDGLLRANQTRPEHEAITFEDLPLDEATYRIIRSDKIQLHNIWELDHQKEERWMQQAWIAMRLEPERFEDIVAGLSLCCEAPYISDVASDYINRKKSTESVSHPHRLCEKYLEETYGVMIYQEQLMHIANAVAGFTMGQADNFRKALAKKKQNEIELYHELFLKGATSHSGLEQTEAEELFNYLENVAGYLSNKSHAVAQALLFYQVAYMMAHFEKEMLEAIIKLRL